MKSLDIAFTGFVIATGSAAVGWTELVEPPGLLPFMLTGVVVTKDDLRRNRR